MTSDEAVMRCLDALEACQIPYMVVGSISRNLYAAPRSTQDADIVVQIAPDSLARLLETLGAEFRLQRQLRFETITATTRHIIDVGDGFFQIELFQLSDDPFDQERFSRRRRVHVLGREAFAPTAEDVVIMKLRWSHHGRRAKDLDDAQNVICAQADQLDWDYIHRWCATHGTRDLLDQIRRSLPPTLGGISV